AADRQMNGDALVRELCAHGLEGTVEVGTLAVEHGHEEHTRETSFLGTVPVPGRLHRDAHDGTQDEQRPFDDAQSGDRIALEAGVAGRVDQVDLPALPLDVLD